MEKSAKKYSPALFFQFYCFMPFLSTSLSGKNIQHTIWKRQSIRSKTDGLSDKRITRFFRSLALYLEAYRFCIAPVSNLVFHSLSLVGGHAAHLLFGGVNRREFSLWYRPLRDADRACGAVLLAAVRQRCIRDKHFLGGAAERFVTGILKNLFSALHPWNFRPFCFIGGDAVS